MTSITVRWQNGDEPTTDEKVIDTVAFYLDFATYYRTPPAAVAGNICTRPRLTVMRDGRAFEITRAAVSPDYAKVILLPTTAGGRG